MLEREFVLKLGFVVDAELSEGVLLKLEYREAGLFCVLKSVSLVVCLMNNSAGPTVVDRG